jgi:hypothetical protein
VVFLAWVGIVLLILAILDIPVAWFLNLFLKEEPFVGPPKPERHVLRKNRRLQK